MWTSRRIKLAVAGCVLLSAGLILGFVVGHIGSSGEEKVPPSKPKIAEFAGVAVPQFETPPPPVSAGSVAAQQLSPPVYFESQSVQQPSMVQQPAIMPRPGAMQQPAMMQQSPVMQQPAIMPQAPVMQQPAIEQQPAENYWADRPVGRNGLIGNPCADPPSVHGAAYSRAY